MAKLKLGEITKLSPEENKSIAEKAYDVAYHFFVDLAILRGENVTGEQVAMAERCRRNSHYKPAFL